MRYWTPQAMFAVCLVCMCATFSLAYGRVLAQGVPKPILVTPLKLTDLPGRWVGLGKLEFRDGEIDKLKCRITYQFRKQTRLVQNIRCKSSKRRVEIKTTFIHANGKITGAWRDRVYEVSGRIKGRLHGNQIQAALSGIFFNAALNIMIIGREQTIEVTPRDNSFRVMRISLARG